jgi:copper chaperone CopZ
MDPNLKALRTIEIEGMTGDVCIAKVRTALAGVRGVTTESVGLGSASIWADEPGCKAACDAINSSGFTAHEASPSQA